MESNELTQALEKAKEKIRNLILDIDDISKKLKLREVKNEDKQ